MFQTEQYHSPLRCLLTWFENLNQQKFLSHLPGQAESSMREHIKKISLLGSWGTDVDILAAASYFQIPVYYCCVDKKSKQWVWNCIEPIARPDQLRYPIVVDSYPAREVSPTHIELVYWRDTHYDSIVSRGSGNASTESPHITVIHDYVDEVL